MICFKLFATTAFKPQKSELCQMRKKKHIWKGPQQQKQRE